MLKKSPFFEFLNRRSDPSFDEYVATHAEDEHFINWNNFLLANDYGDAEFEYHAIRNSCAMCDVTPLRKIRIRGDAAGVFMDRLVTRPVSKLPEMRATYTVFCEDDGSFKDDAIVYMVAGDDYLMMPSDIDHRPYFESVCDRFGYEGVSFAECTDDWVGAAIQGPLSATVLQHIGFDTINELRPFEIREYFLGGGTLSVARMGFTADLGYECWMSPSLVNAFIENIEDVRSELSIDLPGYGLDALQVCRLEGGFIVAGWDCSTEIDPQPGFERSPLELGLSWLVDFDSDFIGRDALVEQRANGTTHTLRYFSIDNEVSLEDGMNIQDDKDTVIGRINNSMWSWGLKKTIGNASILSTHGDLTSGRVMIDGDPVEVAFHRKPLVELERRNQVPAPID